jgi:DNA repair protein RecN (Recombination protein N)
MLLKLYIENYALIDRLEIEFSDGFSVITGETGAGKSILLGALALILGQRADSSVLHDKSRKCIVEGVFAVKGYRLEEYFLTHELEYDDELILRREIHENGKSRAFLNDSPVNLAILKEIGDRLVNIHSQHSIITLNDADFQLAVLDDFAGIAAKVSDYRKQYASYLKIRNELSGIREEGIRAQQAMDYNRFLYTEFETAALKEGEQEEAEQRLAVLSHAGEIKSGLSFSLGTLSENEQNVISQVSEILSHLATVISYHPSLKEISDRLRSNQIDLKDIAAEIGKLEEGIEVYPDELEALTQRLDMIYRLEKKHQAGTVGELIRIAAALEEKLREADTLEDHIGALEKKADEARKALEKIAAEITGKRTPACKGFERKIAGLLMKLGIPDGKLVVEITPSADLTSDGRDRVRFLFSANKGIEPSDVAKIASGGELSRLMLSIKSVISEKNLLPTIIFDEIDNGVSGEVASRVASILKSMAGTMQVIAITHLPQIAGKGDSHYLVYKTNEPGSVRSNIRHLKYEERVNEIAKMLSSEKVTESAYKAAKELITV